MTDLQLHIQNTPLADTHEHLQREAGYVLGGPDVLQDMFDIFYAAADLVVAGADPQAVRRLLDSSNPDIEARWAGVADAWRLCRFTGFGRAVSWIAKEVYGMEEITVAGLESAAARCLSRRRPGERLRILREEANLSHVQSDDFTWACEPDPSGPDYFLYDLSWWHFCNGEVDSVALYEAVGVEVSDLASLRRAMQALFAKYAPVAVAVKAQHAYQRTLLWRERDEAEVERLLLQSLRGQALTQAERLCLGDWCWAQGVELSIEHKLPFKIHTGYYAEYGLLHLDRISAGHLCSLLRRYPEARFVLMHIAYPYTDELVAIAKHFPNAYVDMCWGWSLDPYSAGDFLRKLIHAAPANKVFAFGGDARWPTAALAYAVQARDWLNRSLQAEVDDGLLSEREAMELATRFMQANQEDCFRLADKRAAVAALAQIG